MSNTTSNSRAMRKALKQPNLVRIPKAEWPATDSMSNVPIKVFCSKYFLVQIYSERGERVRITVNSTAQGKDRDYADGIPWDDLQSIKRAVGYGDFFAVEVYPRDLDIVNAANMRHLWVMPEPLSFGWVSGKYDN